MGKVIDISVSIQHGMPLWPGDPALAVERVSDMEAGDPVTVTRLSCGVHTGTHVDAPLHFIRDGASVDELPLSSLVGPVHVFELPDEIKSIGPEELSVLDGWEDAERVLFKTRNSRFWSEPSHSFRSDFTAFTAEGARWLSRWNGLKCVGIDYLSVQLFRDLSSETHQVMLSSGLILIEGLDLSRVSPGKYQLYCLPLKLAGAEGAPARAILVEE